MTGAAVTLTFTWENRKSGSITISLPDSLKDFVEAQLSEKGFGNVSEYFRSLLRDARAREEDARLERLLLEGLASDSVTLDDRFRERLAAKATQVIDAHRKRGGS